MARKSKHYTLVGLLQVFIGLVAFSGGAWKVITLPDDPTWIHLAIIAAAFTFGGAAAGIPGFRNTLSTLVDKAPGLPGLRESKPVQAETPEEDQD